MGDSGGWGRAGRQGALRSAFAGLFDAVPEGLALLDAEGRILRANPALDRMAGPGLPPHPGRPAAELLAPQAGEALRRMLAEALQGGPSRQGAEGPPLFAAPADPAAPADTEWAVRCRPLHGVPGGPFALLWVSDRTEQRRAASRLAGTARLETVGRLASGIAHDFNNLLAAILGSAEAMRLGRLPGSAAEDLRTIEDAAQRGAALVRQLLAFAGQQRLQPRVLDLNAAVEGIAPLLRRLVGPRILLDLALERPGRLVRIDPAQLDQVFLNLAANARDAMPEGGRLRIATGHRVVLRPEGAGAALLPPGRYAVLEVADTGTGIPPEALPRLFEPFFTTRPERGGTGLGLATVQGILAQSGGHVAVSSRPGEGTMFRIHLPRHEGAAPEPAAPPPAAPSGAPPTARILLVEDEAPLRRLTEHLLRRAGYAVSVAESAEAALEAIEGQAAPDALVSDVAMPGMDGLSLARALRARWPSLPVLLLSGYAEVALREDLEAEEFRLLAKPFAPAELLAAVAEALGCGGSRS